MKKTILLLLILFSASAFSQMLYTSNPYPDVMGYYNILSYDQNGSRTVTLMLDSFPTFPGYPKIITGGASPAEGIIYCNMDSDNDLEIVFNSGFNIIALNTDGSYVTGWPQTVSSYPLDCAPAFGDIDGDGQGEIVATSHGLTSGGMIYAFKKNGTPVTGFPINHGYASRTPVLADLNNDGKLEIITNLRLYPVGQEWVYKGDGTVFPGWPRPLSHVPASSAAVGDVNGDNIPEIIAEAYNKLYVWKPNGDSLTGFPFAFPNGDVASYSSPVLADLSGDGKKDIIFGTHILGGGGYVYALKYDATTFGNWPQGVGYWIYSPPSVGDVTGDNQLDVLTGDQIVSFTPVDHLYGWDKNGNNLTGFPLGPFNAINVQTILGDIDNDNQIEMIFDDNSTVGGLGQYLAYNTNGTPVTGWPQQTTGTSFFIVPALMDANNNGILDIAGGGYTSTGQILYTYLWNTGQNWNPSKIILPMFQYNTRHNGVYGDIDIVVGVNGNNNSVPKEFVLGQNYPNPFNPATTIKFSIPSEAKDVKLTVYNEIGQLIETLVDKNIEAGNYEIQWNGSNYPSGIYFYKLQTEQFSDTRKMILIK